LEQQDGIYFEIKLNYYGEKTFLVTLNLWLTMHGGICKTYSSLFVFVTLFKNIIRNL